MAAVGVDIGGSGVRAMTAGAGDRTTAVVARRPIDRDISLAALETVVLSVVAESLSHLDVRPEALGALVAAIPSFVLADGSVADCPSIPALPGVRLGERLQAMTGAAHVRVVPDLAAAALGESVYGAGRGVGRFLCVALGTGANAAMVVDGQVVDTAFGCLGDAGHVLVEPDGPRCACGGCGCLEAVASGWALARDAEAAGLVPGPPLTGAAQSGDADAIALLHRAGIALGRAISTWSVMLWPDLVAVAGGVSGAGDLLLAPARTELARVGPPYVVSRLQVQVAELGELATVVGAAHLAGQLLGDEPTD